MKKYAVLLGVLVFLVALIGGCSMQGAQDGDTVRVHYTGTLDDGTVFDSSEGRDPLEFVVGSGGVISGFDNAVKGMKVGEAKTVTIPAAEAYGPYREDLLLKFSWEQLPEGLNPEVGQMMLVTSPEGETDTLPILEITDEGIVLDANHELAGKDLTFEITLVELEKAG